MIENLMMKSRNAEVNSVASDIKKAFEKTTLSSDTVLLGMMTHLEEANSALTLALKRLKAKSVLEDLDLVRDDQIRALWYLVLGATHHPDTGISDAANMLKAVMDIYGLDMVNESYNVESAHINSMLAKLEAPEFSEAITAVSGCAELIQYLKDAQDAFENTRVQYESVKGNEGAYDNASLIKKTVVIYLNEKLLVYLKGQHAADENTYGSLLLTVNQIIADNNMNVRKRSKKPEAPAS